MTDHDQPHGAGPADPVARVAVLGTGVMGAGMARSLLRDGLVVTVWNRTPDKAAPLADAGAAVAMTPAEAVRDADVVLTILFDADAVLTVMEEAGSAVPDQAVWLQCSTVGVEGTSRTAELAARRGLTLLDAPVLGTRKPAEEGNLVVLVAGDPGLRPRVEPVLDAIGSRTLWVGEEPGPASALKLACNSYVATVTAGLAQSLAVAATLGLEPALVLEALQGGPLDSAYVSIKGSMMVAGDFPVAFALDGLRKDLELAATASRDAGTPAPLSEWLRDLFRRAGDAGLGDQDIAAVHRILT